MEKNAERFILPAAFGEKRRLAAILFLVAEAIAAFAGYKCLFPNLNVMKPLVLCYVFLVVSLLILFANLIIRWFRRRNLYRKLIDGGEKKLIRRGMGVNDK